MHTLVKKKFISLNNLSLCINISSCSRVMFFLFYVITTKFPLTLSSVSIIIKYFKTFLFKIFEINVVIYKLNNIKRKYDKKKSRYFIPILYLH